jgi:hypothetical protein
MMIKMEAFLGLFWRESIPSSLRTYAMETNGLCPNARLGVD